jgi:hypothetical protein
MAISLPDVLVDPRALGLQGSDIPLNARKPTEKVVVRMARLRPLEARKQMSHLICEIKREPAFMDSRNFCAERSSTS